VLFFHLNPSKLISHLCNSIPFTGLSIWVWHFLRANSLFCLGSKMSVRTTLPSCLHWSIFMTSYLLLFSFRRYILSLEIDPSGCVLNHYLSVEGNTVFLSMDNGGNPLLQHPVIRRGTYSSPSQLVRISLHGAECWAHPSPSGVDCGRLCPTLIGARSGLTGRCSTIRVSVLRRAVPRATAG